MKTFVRERAGSCEVEDEDGARCDGAQSATDEDSHRSAC